MSAVADASRLRAATCALVMVLYACGPQRVAWQPRYEAASASSPAASRVTWDAAFDALASRLVDRLPTDRELRLAVLDFAGPRNQEIGVGTRGRDALAERLLASGRVGSLVERAMLRRALAEIHLQRTETPQGEIEFDPDTVISAASLQGANVVVLGVAEPVADQCHFTARLIIIETGTVAAIASTDVPLDDPRVSGSCGDGTERRPSGPPSPAPRGPVVLLDAERLGPGTQPAALGGQFVVQPLNDHHMRGLTLVPQGTNARMSFPVDASGDFELEVRFRVNYGCAPGRGKLGLGLRFDGAPDVQLLLTFDQSDCLGRGGFSITASENGRALARGSTRNLVLESGDSRVSVVRRQTDLMLHADGQWVMTVPGEREATVREVVLSLEDIRPAYGPHLVRAEVRR